MWVTFCGIAALLLEHLKNSFGNEFEHFKSCDIVGKSHFILGTELWGSRYIKAVWLCHWSAAASKPTREGHGMPGQG